MCISLRAAALTAALCLVSLPARADDATLTARGGALSVSGRLVGYDGTVYRIDTAWGRLTVEAAAVDCTGPGCPDLLRFAPEWRLAVEPWLADSVLRPLAQGFARAQGLDLSTPDPTTLEFADAGRPLLRLRLLPLSGAPDPVLAAGDADGALGVPPPGRQPGTLLARLPLLPASAPDAPPGALALGALQSARKERAATWASLGDSARPLVWHSLPPGSALARATDTALGPARAAPQQAHTPDALARALARDPWGLALLPAPLPAGVQTRDVITTCGLTPDLSGFAAAAGEHPLTLALHWLPGSRRAPQLVRDFIAWTVSPRGQVVLADLGLPTPSAQLERPLGAQGQRLANAISAARTGAALEALRKGLTEVRDATQLALSFRFDPREGALDTAGRSALNALGAHLATGALSGHDLLLIGLTDAREPASEGLARARAVQAALAATPDLPPGTTITALGLGAILPLACDDTAEGRRLNRRVEVWVRPTR